MEEVFTYQDYYVYGFNGMLKETDITDVEGAHLDFGARIYDSRLGRWLATDPLSQTTPGISPYVFSANNPIIYVDIEGETITDFINYNNFKNIKNAFRVLNHSFVFRKLMKNFKEYNHKYYQINLQLKTSAFKANADGSIVGGRTEYLITTNDKHVYTLGQYIQNEGTGSDIKSIDIQITYSENKVFSSYDMAVIVAHEMTLHAEKIAQFLLENKDLSSQELLSKIVNEGPTEYEQHLEMTKEDIAFFQVLDEVLVILNTTTDFNNLSENDLNTIDHFNEKMSELNVGEVKGIQNESSYNKFVDAINRSLDHYNKEGGELHGHESKKEFKKEMTKVK